MAASDDVYLAMLGIARSQEGSPRGHSEQQLGAALRLVRKMEAADAVRDWTRPTSVVVGPTFRLLDRLQRQLGCQALDALRQARGLRAGFRLRDPRDRRRVGVFAAGFLEYDGQDGARSGR